ncbi:MAG: dihydrofolate reductase family protein [Deltaproteobacteria bacterium]
MGKLVESTLVTVGGDIGGPDKWGAPFMDDEYKAYSAKLLAEANALLLGRVTYEHFAKAYPAMAKGSEMAPRAFVDRMNAIPKYVASKSLRELTWNATLLDGDAAKAVAAIKRKPDGNLLKFGTGTLDKTLIEHDLIDEFHFWIHPVAVGKAQRLFDGIVDKLSLALHDVHRFRSGIVVLAYGRAAK